MFITQQRAQNIVDEMKASIHRDINIMDETGVILASTNPTRRGNLHSGAAQVIEKGLPSLMIWEDNPGTGVQQGVNLPITLYGETVGVIGITGAPEEVAIFGDIIKKMTEIMVESAQQQEQSDLLDRAKGLFVENWIFAEDPDWQELEMRGQLLGFDIRAPYTVAILTAVVQEPEEGPRQNEPNELRSEQILRLAQSRLREEKNHFCAVIRSRIIVLLCRTGRQAALDLIQRMCWNVGSYYNIEMSGGISGPTTNPADIRRCYLEAQRASAAAAQSVGGQAVFYDQVSLDFIVQSIPRSIRKNLGQMIFSVCTWQEREEFSKLILFYYEEGGDLYRCANRLFIHRSTAQYRLEQLKKRTGYDLRQPKDSVLLYLAALAER